MSDALFWDFDGTLVHSDSLWTGAVYRALNTYKKGNTVSMEAIRVYMRTGFTWHTPQEDYSALLEERWWEFMLRRFSAVYQALGVEKAEADFISTKIRQFILDSDNYELYEDTIAALQYCKDRGYHNYLVSNNYPELPQMMDALKLSPYFEDTIISSKVGFDKPRKEIFEIAKKRAAPHTVRFMIGDNPVADIEGAKQAGLSAILVHGRKECSKEYVFEQLMDITKVLA